MTRELKVLDALPGMGKSTSIFKYMNEHQDKPWLYLSPMKKEIEVRLADDIERLGLTIQFFIAEDKETNKEQKTMTLQVLEALKRKENIACTHALMMRFTDEHIDLLRDNGYGVVCDEELNLISAYNGVNKGDVAYLLENNLISISDVDGMVSINAPIPEDTKYYDFSLYARLGCLFAAKKRNNFLVVQMSPKIIDAANEFILLTYLYKGSIMETFMRMHGFTHTELNLPLLYSERERIAQLAELIEFIETPAVKKVQKLSLSSSWWLSAPQEDLEQLEKSFTTIVKRSKLSIDDVMHTLPKLNHSGFSSAGKTKKIFKPREYDTSKSFVQSTARATNEFRHKQLAIHMLNVYPNQPIVAYMQDMTYVCDSDNHALSTLIQWLFRGCIRDGKKMKVAFFSLRMQTLFKNWLSKGSC